MLMDPLLKSLKDPKILKQVRTRQSFLKYDLNVQCHLLTYLTCLDQFKDPRLVTRTRKVRCHQGKIKARSLMYDKRLIS